MECSMELLAVEGWRVLAAIAHHLELLELRAQREHNFGQCLPRPDAPHRPRLDAEAGQACQPAVAVLVADLVDVLAYLLQVGVERGT